ncbi:MAG TPA: dihydroorotate dehydrogenase-like protein [Vicinamibacterales bacterium]|nr:dihydroorotate dehydrogenase-like protein [Vicinamibacterales bacterium]
MDLTTNYLGLRLPHPVMPGASPLADSLDTVRRLEDAGAAAIVLHSLFEEQITREQLGMVHHMEVHDESFAEAVSYFPKPDEFVFGSEEYCRQIARIKEAVAVPVVASLNGITSEGWLSYAARLQQAGADALELNVYFVATDPAETGAAVEARTVEILRGVKRAVTIPVAVKLSPFYSSLPNLARSLDEAGADGLVLFNRFYQPDIDVEALEATPSLHLSDSSELLLRIRWLAILTGQVRASLAASGGVHTGLDAVKAIMAGASAVQVVSRLLQDGPGQLKTIVGAMRQWLADHEYESLEQARGSMSLRTSPDPSAFERGNYMKILRSWRVA